jgi:UDP-glucuronate 4-epimerase
MNVKDTPMHILVTGAAGFIGYHATLRFLQAGHTVVGIDNLNDYYSPALKEDRLALLRDQASFRFQRLDLADDSGMERLFAQGAFSHVVHLGAQAGVRYSLENPRAYIRANLAGFGNILEGCRQNAVAHLIYASSSSVYGLNTQMPFSTGQNVDHPISLYAATKKSNELTAHSYSHLYGLPCTGLRFFTVYGPWGRPDMALFIFTKAILEDRPIPVFNEGNMRRDFTYIDDIVEGIERLLAHPAAPNPDWNPAAPDPASSSAPYRLYNIGHNQPVALLDFIKTLEDALGKKARLELLPMQAGDVTATYADIEPLAKFVGFTPRTPLAEGIRRFVAWYREYYG